MKKLTLLFCLFLASHGIYACHLSGISLAGSGITEDATDPEGDGIPNYTISINLCVAYGTYATSDTYDVAFAFSGGTLQDVTGYPATIGDAGTWGNTASGSLSGTTVTYDSGTESCGPNVCDQPLADLNGNGQVCAVYVFNVNGLPGQIDLFGVEAVTTTTGSSVGSWDYCNYYYSNTDDTPESIAIDPATLDFTGTTTPLPVEITWMKAFYLEGQSYNTIEWETASEINNDFFAVQASTDGIEYVTVGTVEGAGTSNERNKYSFLHRNPEKITYYRLKQVDDDGSFEFSMIFPIIREMKEKPGIMTVGPNPVSNEVNLEFSYDRNQPVEIMIYNMKGQLVQAANLHNGHASGGHSHNETSSSNHEYGYTNFTMDVQHLSPGLYFITLVNGNLIETKKLTKAIFH